VKLRVGVRSPTVNRGIQFSLPLERSLASTAHVWYVPWPAGCSKLKVRFLHFTNQMMHANFTWSYDMYLTSWLTRKKICIPVRWNPGSVVSPSVPHRWDACVSNGCGHVTWYPSYEYHYEVSRQVLEHVETQVTKLAMLAITRGGNAASLKGECHIILLCWMITQKQQAEWWLLSPNKFPAM
jgi:hypothetical protein